MTWAWIFPDTGPSPYLKAIAFKAYSVACSNIVGSFDRISFVSGVPWQKAIAGSVGLAALLIKVSVSMSTSLIPADRRSERF